MSLETGTYISDLVSTNPVGATDALSTVDDHIRLIKSTLLATFPQITGAMTSTHSELNTLDGYTGNVNDFNILSGAAAAGVTSTEFQYLNGVTSAIQTQLNNRYSVGGTDVPVTDGGTGSSTAAGARTNLGLVIGTDVQAYSSHLAAIAGLSKTDGNIIVANGTTYVAESGATARTSLGIDGSSGNIAYGDLGSDVYGKTKLLASGSLISSGIALTGIESGYRTLVLQIDGCTVSSSSDCFFEYGDGGYETIYITTGYGFDVSGSKIRSENEVTTVLDPLSAVFKVEGNSTSNNPKHFSVWCNYGGAGFVGMGSTASSLAGEVDQIRFAWASSVVAGGTYKLFGIK